MPEVISGTVTKASGDVTKRLPIAETRNELLQLIRAHDTTILVGETGSGKSTQLPQFLLQAGMARVSFRDADDSYHGIQQHTSRQSCILSMHPPFC